MATYRLATTGDCAGECPGGPTLTLVGPGGTFVQTAECPGMTLGGSAIADDTATVTGCVQWPTPRIAGFPCGDLIGQAVIDAWNPTAIDMMFRDTGMRFPGIRCTKTLTVCRCCVCPCWCSACWMDRVDLSTVIPYPVLELVALYEDGVAADAARLAQFRIEAKQYLAPNGYGVAWPTHWRQNKPGDPNTAVWEFRYGRGVPPAVVRARDQLLYLLIMGNEPPADGRHQIIGAEVTVTENNRTITFTPESLSQFREWATKSYGVRAAHVGAFLDPAAASNTTVEAVTYPAA